MTKKVRLNLTNEEKLARDVVSGESLRFNMAEDKIENLLKKKEEDAFNDKVDEYTERFEKHVNGLQEVAENLGADIEKIEIKPLFARILIKPFAQNPFQRIVQDKKTGIITDLGGLAPQYKSMDNGKIEEMEQMIITGAVQEIGPDVKYIVPGDIVMYRKETAMPVPFYKQGFYTIAENQAICVVNEGLTERFDKINGRD